MTVSKKSQVIRFLFDNHGVRGELAQIFDANDRLLENHNYSKPVCLLMRELAVLGVCITSTLKLDGQIMLQIHGGKGDRAVKNAILNINRDLTFYGSCQTVDNNIYDDESTFRDLIGSGGYLHLAIFPKNGQSFQGIVELEAQNLSEAFEKYFSTSDQLPTRFFIFNDTDSNASAGIMLQIIPDVEGNTDSLEHLSILSQTLSVKESIELDVNEILSRLFAHEQVRVFEPTEVDFKCICSKERCLNSLATLSHAELEDIAADENGIEMTCHHCNRSYHLDQQSLKALLLTNSQ